MVIRNTEKERVKTLIKDTITLLCKNGLEFKAKFSLEALIGITLDENEVVLMSINELVKSDTYVSPAASDNETSKTSSKKRKRPRHRKVKTEGSAGQSEGEESDRSETENEPVVKKSHSGASDESDGQGEEELVFVKEELAETWANSSRLDPNNYSEASAVAGTSQDQNFTALADMSLLTQGQSLEWVSGGDSGQGSQGQYMVANPGASTTVANPGASTVTSGSQGDGLSFDQQAVQPVMQNVTFDLLSCSTCPRTFCDPKSLAQHEKKHTSEYKFHCPICNKGFGRRKPFEVHSKTHSEKG